MKRYEVRRISDGITVYESHSRFDCEWFIGEGWFRDPKTTAEDCEIVDLVELHGDEIGIYWHIDDVKEVAPDLTDEQCRQVLRLAKSEHDAKEGVNWSQLGYWADYIREQH